MLLKIPKRYFSLHTCKFFEQIRDPSNNNILLSHLDSFPERVNSMLQNGESLLHHAICKHNYSPVKPLLERKADFNMYTKTNQIEEYTPLHLAVIKKHIPTIEILLSYGGLALVNAPTITINCGSARTALDFVLRDPILFSNLDYKQKGSLHQITQDISVLLLKYGAKSNENLVYLWSAVSQNLGLAVIQILLNNLESAPYMYKMCDKEGYLLMDYARWHRNKKLMEFLSRIAFVTELYNYC